MPKILIAESLDEKVLAAIRLTTKLEFDYKPDISPAELEKTIGDYDGLIVRPKEVSERVIANATRLKLIVRGGTGVNSIALDACEKKGIVVENTPGLNSPAGAEFTILLMLEAFCKRQIQKANEQVRQGQPDDPDAYMGFELNDKKLGIIGYGEIGQRVEKIAAGFGMEISIFKRGDDLHEFLREQQHDIISLHVTLTPETEKMLGEDEFALMKPGVVLIDTARTQLIDIQAFTNALKTGKLGGFGIDGDADLVAPFAKADTEGKGITTPHTGDATFESRAAITRQALEQVIKFFEKKQELNRMR